MDQSEIIESLTGRFDRDDYYAAAEKGAAQRLDAWSAAAA